MRFLNPSFAVKALEASGAFTGYASVFDVRDAQDEVVAPGAFRRSLAGAQQLGRMPAMLWMHDASRPIGVWTALSEDAHGLKVAGQLALRTQAGSEAYELMRLGALTGLSIGYRVVRSEAREKTRLRLLTDVELFEISLVTFPANEAARVQTVKSPHVAPNLHADALAISRDLQRAVSILKTP